MHPIKVVNKRHKYDPKDGPVHYIGRPSPLGNPFRLHAGEPRGATIERYRKHLETAIAKHDPHICHELGYLLYLAREGPLQLECWCAPFPCHGDVIRDILINDMKGE